VTDTLTDKLTGILKDIIMSDITESKRHCTFYSYQLMHSFCKLPSGAFFFCWEEQVSSFTAYDSISSLLTVLCNLCCSSHCNRTAAATDLQLQQTSNSFNTEGGLQRYAFSLCTIYIQVVAGTADEGGSLGSFFFFLNFGRRDR
jgi:hypothetical protein